MGIVSSRSESLLIMPSLADPLFLLKLVSQVLLVRIRYEIHLHGISVPVGDQRMAIAADRPCLSEDIVLLLFRNLVCRYAVYIGNDIVAAAYRLVLFPLVRRGHRRKTAFRHIVHIAGIGEIVCYVRVGFLIENRLAAVVVRTPPVVAGGKCRIRIVGIVPEQLQVCFLLKILLFSLYFLVVYGFPQNVMLRPIEWLMLLG